MSADGTPQQRGRRQHDASRTRVVAHARTIDDLPLFSCIRGIHLRFATLLTLCTVMYRLQRPAEPRRSATQATTRARGPAIARGARFKFRGDNSVATVAGLNKRDRAHPSTKNEPYVSEPRRRAAVPPSRGRQRRQAHTERRCALFLTQPRCSVKSAPTYGAHVWWDSLLAPPAPSMRFAVVTAQQAHCAPLRLRSLVDLQARCSLFPSASA